MSSGGVPAPQSRAQQSPDADDLYGQPPRCAIACWRLTTQLTTAHSAVIRGPGRPFSDQVLFRSGKDILVLPPGSCDLRAQPPHGADSKLMLSSGGCTPSSQPYAGHHSCARRRVAKRAACSLANHGCNRSLKCSAPSDKQGESRDSNYRCPERLNRIVTIDLQARSVGPLPIGSPARPATDSDA